MSSEKNLSTTYQPALFLSVVIVMAITLFVSEQSLISRALAISCMALLLITATTSNKLFDSYKTILLSRQQIFLIGSLLGGTFYFLTYGFEILNPNFIEWRMNGDAAQHFLGWHFFRFEPWHFPLGKIESYDYPIGTSLVYTDSIPLLAIPFKLFSSLLPSPFQYLGIWILLCYLLQGGFAGLLLSRLSKNAFVIAIGTSFFILSPLFWRVIGHESLTAHWLILAAIYLYLQDNSLGNRYCWGGLILITGMVHPYLLLMILIIWLAALSKILLYAHQNRCDIKIYIIAKYMATVIIFLLIELWLIGAFISFSATQYVSGGLGSVSMNLWALFNPNFPPFTSTSLFLNALPLATIGQYEGYSYLGFGVILLLVIAIYEITRSRHYFNKTRDLPLVLACLFLFFFALSNKVTIMDKVLFEIPIPYLIKGVLSIFRATGRMFWPVYYLITLVILAIIIRSNSTKRSILILLSASIIQIFDLSPLYRNLDIKNNVWSTSLQSKLWHQLAEKYDRAVFVPPFLNLNETQYIDWISFGFLAASHGMQLNVAYTARENYKARTDYEQILLKQFYKGELSNDSLYIIADDHFVFDDNVLPITASKGILNGYKVIAPDLKESSITCCLNPWPSTLRIIVDDEHVSLIDLIKNYGYGYSVILSIKDEAKAKMPADFISLMESKTSRINQLSDGGSYIAVIYNGELLDERISNESDVTLELQLPGNYSTRIHSAGIDFGNDSDIHINGWNYSLNKKGINAVVLDNESGVIRRYAFDTHNVVYATSQAQDLDKIYSHIMDRVERAKQKLKSG